MGLVPRLIHSTILEICNYNTYTSCDEINMERIAFTSLYGTHGNTYHPKFCKLLWQKVIEKTHVFGESVQNTTCEHTQ